MNKKYVILNYKNCQTKRQEKSGLPQCLTFLFYNKDVLNELLEIAKNKEYKDVNFPIISTLNKYKNKRVKMFFEKNRME